MRPRTGQAKGTGAPGHRATVATVELPGKEHVERAPRVGVETLSSDWVETLTGSLATISGGQPVTATLSDDGRWRSPDRRVAGFLNLFFGRDYVPRDYHPGGTLAGVATDVAWYFGGTVETIAPELLPEGAVP